MIAYIRCSFAVCIILFAYAFFMHYNAYYFGAFIYYIMIYYCFRNTYIFEFIFIDAAATTSTFVIK